MKLLFLLLFAFSKPNEVREFTHINDNNFIKTEIIIMHSQKVIFIPDSLGISQKWNLESIGDDSYKITKGDQEGIISFTRTTAIMRVDENFTYFTNKRMKAILAPKTR